MQTLRDWSFTRILLLSVGWIVLCLLFVVAWFFFQFRGAFDGSTGSAGIGAVSFGINALVLAIPVAPPVILIVVWSLARWS